MVQDDAGAFRLSPPVKTDEGHENWSAVKAMLRAVALGVRSDSQKRIEGGSLPSSMLFSRKKAHRVYRQDLCIKPPKALGPGIARWLMGGTPRSLR